MHQLFASLALLSDQSETSYWGRVWETVANPVPLGAIPTGLGSLVVLVALRVALTGLVVVSAHVVSDD